MTPRAVPQRLQVVADVERQLVNLSTAGLKTLAEQTEITFIEEWVDAPATAGGSSLQQQSGQ